MLGLQRRGCTAVEPELGPLGCFSSERRGAGGLTLALERGKEGNMKVSAPYTRAVWGRCIPQFKHLNGVSSLQVNGMNPAQE